MLVQPPPVHPMAQPLLLEQPALQSVPEHVTESQSPPLQLAHELSLAEQSGPRHPV